MVEVVAHDGRLTEGRAVLIDQETWALGNCRIRSRSRRIRSDFVEMLMLIPVSSSCSSRARVRPYFASSG